MAGSRDDGLKKSKSEAEFDTIDDYESSTGVEKQGEKPASGGWMPWNWGAKPAPPSQEPEQASSSGTDARL